MPIQKSGFGATPDGRAVDLYTLRTPRGLVAKITPYGARLTELHSPDRHGRHANIVLGHDSLDGYLHDRSYLGATVGRYANRIARASFTLNGRTYTLSSTAPGGPTLHGGKVGFEQHVWTAVPGAEGSSPTLVLTTRSPDGDQGFPGNVEATVIYRLSDDDGLQIEFMATTDQPTPVNMTNHSYFNLAGPGAGDVLACIATINADAYTPTGDAQIPTGEIRPVDGGPFDFRQPKAFGRDMAQVPGGYDHNFVINRAPAGATPALTLAAKVHDPRTGRTLTCRTTQPGVQVYLAGHMTGAERGLGGVYGKHGAFCLETQHFPDSPNQPAFPSTIVQPGQRYHEQALYSFGVE